METLREGCGVPLEVQPFEGSQLYEAQLRDVVAMPNGWVAPVWLPLSDAGSLEAAREAIVDYRNRTDRRVETRIVLVMVVEQTG